MTKNKLTNAKICHENLKLGAKLIKMGSDVPDQKRIAKYEKEQNFLRNLTYRIDRNQRADPLVRHTVLNKSRCAGLESSGYGHSRQRTDMFKTSLLDADSSSLLFPDTSSQGRPFSMQAVVVMNTAGSGRKNQPLQPIKVHKPSIKKVKAATAGKRIRTNLSVEDRSAISGV